MPLPLVSAIAETVFTKPIKDTGAKGLTVGVSLPGPGVAGSDKSVTAGPVGGVPDAVAWLVTEPALMSASVNT